MGTVEVVVHEASRIVSVSRLNAEGRPVASRMCDWDTGDLAGVIAELKVPSPEARDIAEDVKRAHAGLALPAPQPVQPPPILQRLQPVKTFRKAGLWRRFAAVLLDSIIVFLPLGVAVAIMAGVELPERTPGQPPARPEVPLDIQLFALFLVTCYYVLAESLTGTTVGKWLVGIRVVEEDGGQISFGAAVVRNILRPVDSLFMCLVGAIFAAGSPRGQRLGDRAAHTVVVRR